MNEQILFIIEVALLTIGLAGCILPALPGIPLVFAGILVQHFFDPNVDYPIWLLVIMLLLTLLVVAFQYIMPSIGSKKFGASKTAIKGSFVGLVVGLFFPPLGFFIGPFLGATCAELFVERKELEPSLKAGLGALLGLLASTVMELLVSISFVIAFIYFNVK